MTPFNALTATRYGRMIYHANDLFIGRALQLYGEWSPGEMNLYRHLLKPGDVVVEAGANVGALTVPIAQCVGEEGRVYAFEPQRLTYHALCGNLALNSIANTITLNLALGAEAGVTHVPQVDLSAEGNFGAVALEPEGTPNMDVVTVDFYEFPRVDLLKLDVEGMEYDILMGSEETVAFCRPTIVLELERKEVVSQTIDWLVDHAYTLYAHYPPLAAGKEAWSGTVSFNALAVPTEQAQPTKRDLKTFGLLDLQEITP